MLSLLSILLANLRSMFRSRAAVGLENFALRHQIGVLQRSAEKRPKLTPADRLVWVILSRIWSDWRSALAIVKPETVIAWHRKGFRLFWAWKVRRGHGARSEDYTTLTNDALREETQAIKVSLRWFCETARRTQCTFANALTFPIDRQNRFHVSRTVQRIRGS